MNVLILLKSFNYPPKNGGDQAVVNAIETLSSYVHYHLISMDDSIEGRITISRFGKDHPSIPSIVFESSIAKKYTTIYDKCIRVSNFLNNRNGNKRVVDMRLLQYYDAQLDYRDSFYRFINKYIANNKIDIVQSEFSFTLGLLKGITGKVKKVFVQHEIQFVVNYQRLMQREHTDDDMYFYEQERQQEINGLNCCDAIITLSEDDRQKLILNGVHAPIFASFAQVKLQNNEIELPVKLKKRLVFIGPETHMPNKQGMQWFLDNVWLKVLKDEPSTELAVIGKWSKETIDKWRLKYGNLIFMGYVDDLHSAIKESVLIVPLFQGSGIRMKILEACNIGIPFVSTTIGAEGLGFTDGENAYITDDIDVFAKDILVLLKHENLANSFISKSKENIRVNFSTKRFVESRLSCYNALNTIINEFEK